MQTDSQNRKDIQNGSKSFSLASLAFAPQDRESAWCLYAWCRFADDQVDEATTPTQAASQLQDMNHILAGKIPSQKYPWPGFLQLLRLKAIPLAYPQDLLRGFAKDLGALRIQTEAELMDYCYCVAGTVGLMMSHIVGVNDHRALPRAVALGQAMQLTNIARDVKEDFSRGRIYLPEEILQSAGVDLLDPLGDASIAKMKGVVDQTLLKAEDLYSEGEKGLRNLPFRASLAVGSALLIYREIGRRILASPPEVLLSRVVISKPRKLFLFAFAFARSLQDIPYRILRPWKPQQDLPLWRAV